MRMLIGAACPAVLAAWLAPGAAGCGGDAKREEPAPDAAAEVRDAALRTLGGGPANIRINVSSATAE